MGGGAVGANERLQRVINYEKYSEMYISVSKRVILSANHFVTVVLLSKDPETGLDDTSSQTKNQVQSGLLLDVVVRQGTAFFQLLASKNQPLLVWWNACKQNTNSVSCVKTMKIKKFNLSLLNAEFKVFHFNRYLR